MKQRKLINLLIFIIIVALIVIFAIMFISPDKKAIAPVTTPDYSAACLENDGNWLAQYNECENISQQWCNNMGGLFDECASACRHDLEAEMCIEVCVPVCYLNS